MSRFVPERIPSTAEPMVRARAIIPVEFHPMTYVAGGAAACYPISHQDGGDVDIYILASRTQFPDYRTRADAWRRLVVACTAAHERDAAPGPFLPTYDNLPVTMLYTHDRLQIMRVYSPMTPADLVDNFDISCHMAYGPLVGDGRTVGPQYNATPTIIQWRESTRTFQRWLKFCHRYHDFGSLPHDNTVRCLLDFMSDNPNADAVNRMTYQRFQQLLSRPLPPTGL